MSEIQSDPNPTSPVLIGLSGQVRSRDFIRWDLLGLTRVLGLPFFPQSFSGLHCVIGLPESYLKLNSELKLRVMFRNLENPKDHGYSDVSLTVTEHPSKEGHPVNLVASPSDSNGQSSLEVVKRPGESNAVQIMPVPCPPMVAKSPGSYAVDIQVNGVTHILGRFRTAFVPTKPLDPPERKALMAKVSAIQLVGILIECNKCNGKVRIVSTLDKWKQIPKVDGDGTIQEHIRSCADHWSCSCGNMSQDLTYAKQGLDDIFRHGKISMKSKELKMDFTPAYQANKISDIIAGYDSLINSTPREEDVQKYLEENDIFWSFLAPVRIWNKPSFISLKSADFAVHNTKGILYYIEIEKPSTQILKDDGGIAADIQKGANQIRQWREYCDDHRHALLKILDLEPKEVTDIKYILIGGLTINNDPKKMRTLRLQSPFGSDIDFYTFDDLLSGLSILSRLVEQL